MTAYSIQPVPTEEQAAAIVAALEFLTPVATSAQAPVLPDVAWRFSGRSWTSQMGWPARAR
ncbi:MAG: hypothetical protein R2770_13030 [Acidimicrobiales bacterium]|nr:hypothetical protein [Acidimicrobiales bacterium]